MSIHLATIPMSCEKSTCGAEEYVQIFIPPSSIPQAKYQIEESLAPLIKQIKAKKREQLLGKKMIHLTACIFLKEVKEKSWSTAMKASLVLFSIAAFHPVLVGSMACMNAYRLMNWNDLYSSDLNAATLASQLFSNLGQGISFLIQGTHALIFTSSLLVGPSYELARSQIILGIYDEVHYQLICEEERNFINEMRKSEFITHCNLNNIESKDEWGPELKSLVQDIEEEKTKQLSFRNVVWLTVCEFNQEAKKHPWTSMCKVSLLGLSIAALHPFILGTIACLDAYRVDSSEHVFSTDLNVANNATQTFSNTGHVIEYLSGGIGMMALSSKFLLQNCYKKVHIKIINDIFDKKIRDDSLTTKESDYLYEMKQIELISNGLIDLNIPII